MQINLNSKKVSSDKLKKKTFFHPILKNNKFAFLSAIEHSNENSLCV